MSTPAQAYEALTRRPPLPRLPSLPPHPPTAAIDPQTALASLPSVARAPALAMISPRQSCHASPLYARPSMMPSPLSPLSPRAPERGGREEYAYALSEASPVDPAQTQQTHSLSASHAWHSTSHEHTAHSHHLRTPVPETPYPYYVNVDDYLRTPAGRASASAGRSKSHGASPVPPLPTEPLRVNKRHQQQYLLPPPPPPQPQQVQHTLEGRHVHEHRHASLHHHVYHHRPLPSRPDAQHVRVLPQQPQPQQPQPPAPAPSPPQQEAQVHHHYHPSGRTLTAPKTSPSLALTSTNTTPRKSPKKSPPPPIDLASVRKAYPTRRVENEDQSVVFDFSVAREERSERSERESDRHEHETHATTTRERNGSSNRSDAARTTHARTHASHTHSRSTSAHTHDPHPVPFHPTRGEGDRYPAWAGATAPPHKWAASRQGDMGNNVLDEVVLTPLAVPRAPPPVRPVLPGPGGLGPTLGRAHAKQGFSAVDTARSAARAARRASAHVMAAAKRNKGWEKMEKGERGQPDAARKVQEKNRKKRRLCLLILVIVIISIIVGLCVGLLGKKPGALTADGSTDPAGGSVGGLASASGTMSGTASPATTSGTPLDKCLGTWLAGKPFSCAACVPLLSRAPNDFLTDDDTGVGSALQYCALLDVLASVGEKNALQKGGWGSDSDPCTWSGIQCDTRDRVISIALDATLVAVPKSIGALVGLKELNIHGNATHPAGPLPLAEVASLKNLTALTVANTRLTGPIDAMDFSGLQLAQLTLANNSALGSVLPNLSMCGSLESYTLSGHGVTQFTPSALPASITALDLSLNALTGAVPSFANFSLQSLNLQSNKYTTLGSLPSTLVQLDLSNNANLQGAMPLSLCNSTNIECSIENTRLQGPLVGKVQYLTCGACEP